MIKSLKFSKEICAVSTGEYYPDLTTPLKKLRDIVSRYGFDTAEFDEEVIYCGRDGRAKFNVHKAFDIVFVWHKMEVSGRYEVVAYVS